jgi:hypothetical protein
MASYERSIASAAANNLKNSKVQLTQFGAHGTNYSQIMIPTNSAQMPNFANQALLQPVLS